MSAFFPLSIENLPAVRVGLKHLKMAEQAREEVRARARKAEDGCARAHRAIDNRDQGFELHITYEWSCEEGEADARVKHET